MPRQSGARLLPPAMKPVRRQKGAFAILFAVAFPVLFGMIGMGYTVGEIFITRTQLQSAADSCALAAVSRLIINDYTSAGTYAARAATLNDALKAGLNEAGAKKINLTVEFSDVERPSEATPPTDWGVLKATSRSVRCVATKEGGVVRTMMSVLPGGDSIANVKASAMGGIAYYQYACYTNLAVCGSQSPGTVITGEWQNNSSGYAKDPVNRFLYVNVNSKSEGSLDSTKLLKQNRCILESDLDPVDSFPGISSSANPKPDWNNNVQSNPYRIVPVGTCKTDNGKSKEIKFTQSGVAKKDFACIQMILNADVNKNLPEIKILGKPDFGSRCASSFALARDLSNGQRVAVLY